MAAADHQICVLDSHKRRLGISLKGHPDELWDAGQHFIRESHCLLLELDIWGNSLSALPQHFRVTVSAMSRSSVQTLTSVRRLHLQIHGCRLHPWRGE